MAWRKLGLVFAPPHDLAWMSSHAALPAIDPAGSRVYFSGRDRGGRAHIGWFDLDPDDPSRVRAVSPEPVVSPGPPGAFDDSGLGPWLAQRLGALGGLPPIAAIAGVTLFFVLLTELTSNTATAAMAMPIVAAVAPAIGAHPVSLMAAAALGSAMGFMLPVGTPPNALAFGSGAVSAAEMRRAGLWLDLVGVAVITAVVAVWGRALGATP